MSDLRDLSVAPADSNAQEPLKESPSQTAGPYVHIGCLPNYLGMDGIYEHDLVDNGPLPDGKKITVQGHIYDGSGAVGKDMLIESWQRSSPHNPEVGVWLRTPTDLETGLFTLNTILPDAIADQAPHLKLWIVARGINLGLHTRIYFDDIDNMNDPVLNLVPLKRYKTLIAKNVDGVYQFDIHLQGDKETVFFDV